jgi:hypothetical protein
MEEVALLYSGGKDSSLAAHMLSKYYKVKLLTATFGILDSWKYAKESANIIGFEHEVKKFVRSVIEEASEMIIKDGFPKNGINFIHRHVLSAAAKEHKLVADGTRRDDRVPLLRRREIRSLEDMYGIEYIAPLRGLGYKTINRLATKIFKIEEGESGKIQHADYEAEIRAVLKEKGCEVKNFFPSHKQSRVIGVHTWAR